MALLAAAPAGIEGRPARVADIVPLTPVSHAYEGLAGHGRLPPVQQGIVPDHLGPARPLLAALLAAFWIPASCGILRACVWARARARGIGGTPLSGAWWAGAAAA